MEEVISVRIKGDTTELQTGSSKSIVSLDKLSSSLKKTAVNTGAAGQSITSFGRVLQDLPFGPGGIANNLEGAALSMKALREESKLTGQSIGSILLQQLKGGGGLIAGMSLLSAGLSFATFGLDAWTRMFGNAGKEAKKAGDEIKDVTDVIAASGSEYTKAVQSVQQLSIHVGLAKQGFIDKEKVVKEYNESIGKTIGQVKSLDEVEQSLGKNAKAYIQFTLLKASANVALAEASKKAFEVAKENMRPVTTDEAVNGSQRTALEEQAKQTVEYAALYKKANGALLEGNKDAKKYWAEVDQYITDFVNKRLNKKLIQEQDQFLAIAENFNKRAADISREFKFKDFLGGEFDTKAKQGAKPQFNFFDQYFDVKPDKNRIRKQLEDMANAAKDFASKNSKLFQGLDAVLFAPSQATTIEAGRKFWNDFQNGLVKFKPQKFELGDLNQVPEIKPISLPDVSKAFARPFENLGAIDIPLNKEQILADFKLQFAQIGRDLPKQIGVLDPITGIEQPVSVATVINTANLQKGLADARQRALEGIKSLNASINTALQGLATKGFVSVGEGIAAALSGGGLHEAFKSLGAFLGDAIQRLGEQMIALSPIILGIQAAIKSFNPALLLPAGIALTALGAVIKNMFASSLPGLATGGIIPPGYPNDSFPAMLQSGEAVIPLDRLAAFIGNVGAPQTVFVAQRLRGRDVVLQQAREQKAQRRGG